MAAKGYPGSYKKGSLIRGLDDVTDAKVSGWCIQAEHASCCESFCSTCYLCLAQEALHVSLF